MPRILPSPYFFTSSSCYLYVFCFYLTSILKSFSSMPLRISGNLMVANTYLSLLSGLSIIFLKFLCLSFTDFPSDFCSLFSTPWRFYFLQFICYYYFFSFILANYSSCFRCLSMASYLAFSSSILDSSPILLVFMRHRSP